MQIKTINVDLNEQLKELIGIPIRQITVVDNTVILRVDELRAYHVKFSDVEYVAVKVKTDMVATIIIRLGDVWINMVITSIHYEDGTLRIDGEVVGDVKKWL